VSVGFAYRSTIKVNFKGDVQLKNIAPALQPLFNGSEFSSDMSTSMKFPDIISLGVAYRPTAKLTLALDLEEIRWSTFRSSMINLQNEVPQAGITSGSTELDWKNMWTAKIGAEYRATDRLSLRGGYAYVARAVPDNTLDPGNPDSTEHNFSIGFGYKKGRLVMDFFYMAGFFENRTVTNPILSGNYKNFVNYIGVGTGYRF
jgi:long-chain fatty acid transport protein